jgi:drug/metabolite transporter (DMT)-like permease
MTPVYFALASNLAFSVAILIFTSFSLRTSVLWTNCFKALVAFIAFFLSVSLFAGWSDIAWSPLLAFLTSGLIGLALGDMFLLKGFTLIGPSRSMVLFGFQPLFLAVAARVLFGQSLDLSRLFAVLFLIACLVSFSYERYVQHKNWGLKGIGCALAAVLLDTVGILMTRFAFDTDPNLHVFEGNAYRCAGALIGFAFLHQWYQKIEFTKHLKRLNAKTLGLILLGSFLGTYLSLALYLQAIKTGHLASISAIAITGPFFAAILEHVYLKKWPSKSFALAFVFFILGFYFLNV